MALIDKLRALVDEYSGKPFPEEWKDYPATGEEGKRLILEALVARKPLPKFAHQAWTLPIHYYAGPFKPMDCNPNGWCQSSYTIGWREVLEAVVEARIKEMTQ